MVVVYIYVCVCVGCSCGSRCHDRGYICSWQITWVASGLRWHCVFLMVLPERDEIGHTGRKECKQKCSSVRIVYGLGFISWG